MNSTLETLELFVYLFTFLFSNIFRLVLIYFEIYPVLIILY